MKPTKRPRGESSKSASSGDDSNRQRGRPRIDTTDETATERRRTQIRLAQRAYRERKETTISALNKRVVKLETIIADMNSNFSDFESKARQSGVLDSGLTTQLSQAVDTMTDLVSKGVKESPEPEDGERVISPTEKVLSAREVPNVHRRPTGSTTTPEPASVWGYEINHDISTTYDEATVPSEGQQSGNLSNYDWTTADSMQNLLTEAPTHPAPAFGWQTSGVWENQDTSNPHHTSDPTPGAGDEQINGSIPQPWQRSNYDSQQYNANMPETAMPPKDTFASAVAKELPLPTTHSYTERSFARRILRTALESAHHLLTDSGSNPVELKRLCRFAYCFISQETLLSHIRNLLSRRPDENFELWNVPFLHVGNSGLHYPRDGIDAGLKPPEGWANPMSMGPYRKFKPQFSEVNHVPLHDRIEYAGVGGEWFDSNDVEQYLRIKGLHVNSTSSIVEIEDPVNASLPGTEDMNSLISPETSSYQDGSSAPDSPETLYPTALNEAFQSPNDADLLFEPFGAQQATGADGNTTSDTFRFDNAESFGCSFDFNMFPLNQPTFNPKPKKIFDVDLFLESECYQAC